MTDYIDDLRKRFPTRFITERHYGEEIVYLASEDQISLDVIGQSNCECIAQAYEWVTEEGGRPYHRFIFIPVEEITEEIAEELEDLLDSLERYPIYDESDYCEREHKYILEYVEDSLPWDLCYEIDNRTDECEDRIKHWLRNNMEAVWECNDGSVDDQPINVTELSKELPYWVGELA